MKITNIQSAYSAQLNSLRKQRKSLLSEQKAMEGIEEYRPEYDKLTLSLEKIDEEYETLQNSMDEVLERQMMLENIKNAKEQGDSMAEAYEDMAKCMEIARRIASGAKVPAKDAKKLMEFSSEMYMLAVNEAMMARKTGKEYDSLWEDEEEENAQESDSQAGDAEQTEECPET